MKVLNSGNLIRDFGKMNVVASEKKRFEISIFDLGIFLKNEF